MKKILSVLLALVMALSLTTLAWATEPMSDYVQVNGIKEFDGEKFSTFEAAYNAIQPKIAELAKNPNNAASTGLVEEPVSADKFDAFFSDVDANGNATLTYTIKGNVTYDETSLDHLLTMGRAASHYANETEDFSGRHLINFKFVGADANRGATLTVNSDITLPYEWWGEEVTTSISFENLTITGTAPSGLYTKQAYFEKIAFSVNNCTLKGIKIYNCDNVGGSYTITNSTLDGTGAAKDAYAIHLQGHKTAPLTITISNNTISGYDRGVNIDQKTARATIHGNTISIVDKGRSCVQLTGLTSADITNNNLVLTGGNAITLHEGLLDLSASPTISITGNTITGTGYFIYDDAKANQSDFTQNNLTLTVNGNTIPGTVDTTKGIKGTTIVENSDYVAKAVEANVPPTPPVTPVDPTPDPEPAAPAHTNRRYPATTTTTTTETPEKGNDVTSAKTFDAGIALYLGLSALSLSGSAVLMGRKKEF